MHDWNVGMLKLCCNAVKELRFVDDIRLFAQSRVETGNLCATCVKQLDRVALLLSPEKSMVITNEAQPSQTITTTAGMTLVILPRDGGQKWLGSMLTPRGLKLQTVDLQHCLQQASYEPADIAKQKCFHCKAFTVL